MDYNDWKLWNTLSYAMGHNLNDMCASTWFSYLLIFLHEAVGLTPVEAGIVMFSGQIADAIATPLVGVISDKSTGCPSLGLGRRKTWLAMGTVLVLCTYYMVFGTCWLDWVVKYPSQMSLVVYYSIAAALFNVGWATVQVNHMALVPELTNCDNIRCTLNSYRYAFTILSNVLVFCVFFLLLHYASPVGDPDRYKFKLLADFIVVVGILTTCGFLQGTKEDIQSNLSEHSSPEKMKSAMEWYEWFSIPRFYEIGVVYMCTRLVINITQVYLPFYLTVALKLSATSIAIVPMLVYISGFIATFFLRYFNAAFGRNETYLCGGGIVIVALVLCLVLTESDPLWIYPLSIVLGIGNSIIMITSICMEGDLVGDSTNGSAFVYGAMSFTDKLSNGIAIVIIQHGRQAIMGMYGGKSVQDATYTRETFCLIPIGAIIVGMVMVYLMHCHSDDSIFACFQNNKRKDYDMVKQYSYGSMDNATI